MIIIYKLHNKLKIFTAKITSELPVLDKYLEKNESSIISQISKVNPGFSSLALKNYFTNIAINFLNHNLKDTTPIIVLKSTNKNLLSNIRKDFVNSTYKANTDYVSYSKSDISSVTLFNYTNDGLNHTVSARIKIKSKSQNNEYYNLDLTTFINSNIHLNLI